MLLLIPKQVGYLKMLLKHVCWAHRCKGNYSLLATAPLLHYLSPLNGSACARHGLYFVKGLQYQTVAYDLEWPKSFETHIFFSHEAIVKHHQMCHLGSPTALCCDFSQPSAPRKFWSYVTKQTAPLHTGILAPQLIPSQSTRKLWTLEELFPDSTNHA